MLKKVLAIIFSFCILTSCNSSSQQSTTSTSTQQVETTKDSQQYDKKISVASVAISQILSEMGQDIVGRPTTKLELPEEYVNVSEIGSSFSVDFEKVLAVGTELLIGDTLFKDKIEKTAQEYGIETFFVDTSTYDKFTSSILDLGKKIEKEAEAQAIVDRFEAPLANLQNINKDLRVAIISGTSESNMLATKDSYVGSLVERLGVKNIADEIVDSDSNIQISNGYINLNLEQILKNQPDIILRFGHGNVEEANKAFEKLFNENPAWNSLEAIKNGKIYDLDANIFGPSANSKIDQAFEQLGEILNGQ